MMLLDGQFSFMPECRFTENILWSWWKTKRNPGRGFLEVSKPNEILYNEALFAIVT